MDGGDPESEAESAAATLEERLEAVDGEPTCALCSAGADFFLYEPDRVAKFVCWEHVSPLSAAVDGDLDETDRPVAIPLSEEFS